MSFRAPMPVVIGAIALALAVLVGLGSWQVSRYFWKQGVIAERNARTTGRAVDAATLLRATPSDVDWLHVTATGAWDNAHTMLVANRVRFDVLGAEAVTPLLLAPQGPAVLVDRGWFPLEQQAAILARLNAETTATVEGMATAANLFHGRVIPSGAWSQLDPVAMAKTLPYPALPWAVLQGRLVSDFQFDNGALPLQQYRGYQNTTPHVEYAATWFGLAAALLAVSIIRFWVAPRREERARRSSPEPDAGTNG
jgi:surfeit locus 1 family protein